MCDDNSTCFTLCSVLSVCCGAERTGHSIDRGNRSTAVHAIRFGALELLAQYCCIVVNYRQKEENEEEKGEEEEGRRRRRTTRRRRGGTLHAVRIYCCVRSCLVRVFFFKGVMAISFLRLSDRCERDGVDGVSGLPACGPLTALSNYSSTTSSSVSEKSVGHPRGGAMPTATRPQHSCTYHSGR